MTVKTLSQENPMTINETIPLSDLKEPLNVLVSNAGKSSQELYEDLLQEEKHYPSVVYAVN